MLASIVIVYSFSLSLAAHWSPVLRCCAIEQRRTRAGVWVHNGNPLLAGTMLEEALLRAILSSASQSRKIEEDWHFLFRVRKGLRREIEVEAHFAARCGRLVVQLEELAPK